MTASQQMDPDPQAVDIDHFKWAMGSFTTGVAIVTSGRTGAFSGLTASSLASVSLEPPSLLVCVRQGTSSHDAIMDSGRFAVNIMGVGDDDLARRFARPDQGQAKFDGIDLAQDRFGTPRLPQAVAHMSCRLAHDLVVGTHRIIVGYVDDLAFSDREPLVYFRGGFGSFEAAS